jgi:uncharacterized membrane protein YcaP (DUF421 family)
VLIADASQNAMSSNYQSVVDGLVLIATIVFWNYALDFLTSRFPRIERFTYPPPILLVRNGKVIPKNMRRQFVTHEQLMSLLREHGVETISKVKAAYLEGSGHTSVIPVEGEEVAEDPNQHRMAI